MAPTQTLTYDNLVTSTMAARATQVKEQVLKEHKAWAELSKRRKTSGMGHQIEVPVEYGENNTVGYLDSIEDEITVTDQQHLTLARYNPSLLAGVVKWNEEEKAQNSGKERFINLMEVKERRLKATFRRILSQNLYGDGSGKKTNGLAMYVPTAVGSNTVGGLAEATYAWWKSQVRASGGSFAANGIFGATTDYVLNMFIACSDDTMPDLLLSDATVFEFAHRNFGQDVAYHNNKNFGTIGKLELMYQGVRWVWDKDADAATLFFLHTDSFILYETPGMAMNQTEVMTPPNQPWVKFIAFIYRHQLACDKRMLNGRISAWTA